MSTSTAYHNTAGKADVHDAQTGTKVDHVAGMKVWKDPAQPLRYRIATRIADHVSGIECPTCVDVGCSLGNDCATLLAALGRTAKVTGVDIMEAQITTARERVPAATFVQGDASKLPFDDASVDSIQCARMLIHAPDLHAVLNEFVRVMKPGAIAVFYEGDYRTNALLTSDMAIAKVHAAKMSMTVGGIAHPNVAQEILQYLLASPEVEQVTFDGYPSVQRDPTYGFPGMRELEKGKLQKLVELGTLTQEEVAAYDEGLDAAVASGNWVETGILFEIGFFKKG